MIGNFFTKLISAFKYAIQGFRTGIRSRNMQIHLIITLITLTGGLLLRLSLTEFLIILVFISVVISLELLNSAMEELCNLVESSYNPHVKKIKDMAAAAVLWSSLIALIAGIAIFAPRIFRLLQADKFLLN